MYGNINKVVKFSNILSVEMAMLLVEMSVISMGEVIVYRFQVAFPFNILMKQAGIYSLW